MSDAIKMNFADCLKDLKKVDLINTSLESGSNTIVQLMNKGFTMEEFWEFYNKINSVDKKDFYFSIISGFPTETLDDCQATISVIKRVRPKLVNINTYVDSLFIPAHNLEQLSEEQTGEHTKVYTKAMKRNFIRHMVNLGK